MYNKTFRIEVQAMVRFRKFLDLLLPLALIAVINGQITGDFGQFNDFGQFTGDFGGFEQFTGDFGQFGNFGQFTGNIGRLLGTSAGLSGAGCLATGVLGAVAYDILTPTPTTSTATTTTTETCPSNFQTIETGTGSCYYVCPAETGSWMTAQDACEKLGAHMYEPNTQAEVDAVATIMDTSADYWTGGNDHATEGTAVFEGTDAAFTLPISTLSSNSNTANKDCIEMDYVSSAWRFEWRSCTTTSNRRCLCEKDLT